jgi:hypothetical protein
MKNRTTMTTTGPESGKPKSVMQDFMVETRKSPAVDARNANLMNRDRIKAMMDAADNYYNSVPFKNNAIDILNRRRYDISSEFDGQEVQGTMTERPTIGGGMVETERYNMPGGGSRMERTRFNADGMPVKRVIKDKKINR